MWKNNFGIIDAFMKLNIFENIYALIMDCTSYVGEKTKAVIKDPLSLTALHYHIFIGSSRCAAYVKSDQRRIEFFLQVLCVVINEIYTLLYCYIMATMCKPIFLYLGT